MPKLLHLMCALVVCVGSLAAVGCGSRQPLPFVVGTGVIQGFSQAVIGMRVGGTRRVVMPSSLAYGSQGSGTIPPNTPLVFEISLLTVQ
jgi:FKBP-type peptidyl-prolyl cis-trans isomerase